MILAKINNGLGWTLTVSAHFWRLQNNWQQFKIMIMIKIHGRKLIPSTHHANHNKIKQTCIIYSSQPISSYDLC